MATPHEVYVVIINGYPQSGKDSFVEYCSLAVDKSTAVHHFSTVDMVKEALTLLGWSGAKTNDIRDLMSNMKDQSVQLFDGPYRYIVQKVREIERYEYLPVNIIFVDSREPEEIARFAKTLNAATLLIRREPKDLPSNHADNLVEKYTYDYVVVNDGTLEDLADYANIFLSKILSDKEVEECRLIGK